MESRIGLYGKEIKLEKNRFPKIHDSLFKVNKALSYTAKIDAGMAYIQIESKSHPPRTKEDFLITIEILIPLIVFDGALYSWEKEEGVVEQKQILVRSQYKSNHYNWNRLVPIVRIGQLPTFLDCLNKDLDKAHQSLIKEVEKYDFQIKNLVKIF